MGTGLFFLVVRPLRRERQDALLQERVLQEQRLQEQGLQEPALDEPARQEPAQAPPREQKAAIDRKPEDLDPRSQH